MNSTEFDETEEGFPLVEKKKVKKNKDRIKTDICFDLYTLVKKSTEEMGIPVFDLGKFGIDTFSHMVTIEK